MERVCRERKPEIFILSENVCPAAAGNDAPQRPKADNKEGTAAAPDVKVLRLLAVTVGVLCILQAALNVSLRLLLFSKYDSLTEERDELTEINFDMEARNKNLTEEREELKTRLKDFASKFHLLTEERDELRRINYATEGRCNSLSAERDDLTRRLKDVTAQRDSRSRERDQLRGQLNSCAFQTRTLTNQRDDLRRKLNAFADLSHNEWLYFSRSFYFISSIKKNWYESRNDCWNKGAHLVVINSVAEQAFVRRQNRDMWIGLIKLSGSWKWVDTTSLASSFWCGGEPNNQGRNEDCVETTGCSSLYSWNDLECRHGNYWICEKEMSF